MEENAAEDERHYDLTKWKFKVEDGELIVKKIEPDWRDRVKTKQA